MITILLALTQVTLGLDSMSHYSPVEVTGVKLPLYGMYGGVAELRCHYTSVMPVYSIKWYKNGKEFYRLEARSYEEFRFITQLHYIKSIAAISRAKLIQ